MVTSSSLRPGIYCYIDLETEIHVKMQYPQIQPVFKSNSNSKQPTQASSKPLTIRYAPHFSYALETQDTDVRSADPGKSPHPGANQLSGICALSEFRYNFRQKERDNPFGRERTRRIYGSLKPARRPLSYDYTTADEWNKVVPNQAENARAIANINRSTQGSNGKLIESARDPRDTQPELSTTATTYGSDHSGTLTADGIAAYSLRSSKLIRRLAETIRHRELNFQASGDEGQAVTDQGIATASGHPARTYAYPRLIPQAMNPEPLVRERATGTSSERGIFIVKPFSPTFKRLMAVKAVPLFKIRALHSALPDSSSGRNTGKLRKPILNADCPFGRQFGT
ncbi:hypothetical protein C8R45DRAFT_939691 [Mycena sanguinolenta]|nr:hypothetical protein C8R45DRAFT_939691 [Mycena sanguinolenta]